MVLPRGNAVTDKEETRVARSPYNQQRRQTELAKQKKKEAKRQKRLEKKQQDDEAQEDGAEETDEAQAVDGKEGNTDSAGA